MRIKSLQIRARVAVEGFIKGIHRSPYHGFSVEFSEYREYSPGDDPRYLDWRLYARSDRYYVKRFEDETNLRCNLVVDTSRSMGYRSGPVQQERLRTHCRSDDRLFSGHPARCCRPALVRGSNHRLSAGAISSGHLRRLMAALDREPAGPVDESGRTARADCSDGSKARADRPDLGSAGPGRFIASPARIPAFSRARCRRAADPRPGGSEFHVHRTCDVSRRRIGQRALHRPGGGTRELPAKVCRACRHF